jgi:hypothetical protein
MADWDKSAVCIAEDPTQRRTFEIINALDSETIDVYQANLWSNGEEMAPTDATWAFSPEEADSYPYASCVKARAYV